MAIKALWTFAHMTGVTTANTSGGGLQYTQYPMTFNPVTGSPTGGVTSAGLYALTAVTSGAVTQQGRLEVILSNVMDWTTRSSWFGFGYQGTNTAGTDPQTILSWLTGTTVTSILSESEFAFNRSQNYWIEVQIDRTNKAINVYVDGNFVKSVSFTATSLTAASTMLFGHGGQVGTVANTGVRYFREMYWLDDTQDSTQCTRWGPRQVVPINCSAVTGTGWTYTFLSSLLAVQNSALSGTPPSSTPQCVSPLTQAPLVSTLNLNGSLQTQQTIDAVSMVQTAQRGAGTSAVVQNNLSYTPSGGSVQNKAMNTLTFADTNMKYNCNIGIAEKAPDGTAWTAAKIAATTLTQTPASA